MGKQATHIKQKSKNTNTKKKFKKNKRGPDKGKENHTEGKRKKRARDDSEDEYDDNEMNMDFDDNECPNGFYNFSSATSQLSSDWAFDEEEDGNEESQQTLEEIVASKGLEKFTVKEIEDNVAKPEKIPFQKLNCLTDLIREKLPKFTKIHVTKDMTDTLELILKGAPVNRILRDTEGKRLALSVAALELVIRRSFSDSPEGTAVVMICKNYKDARNIEGFLNYIAQDLELSIGVLVGGKSGELEEPAIQKGLDIVIATPKRLLYHLENTSGFSLKNLTSLIIDDADFFIKNNLRDDLVKICKQTFGRSQTVVLSVKDKTDTEKLTKIGAKKSASALLPFDQAYLICPLKRKFQILHAILETNRRKKVIVFMRTSSQVEFFGNILFKLDLAVLHLDESQTEEARIKYLNMFKSACAGIMLATDKSVAKHEFHRVSVIIHFDVPEGAKQYMERVSYLSKSEKNATTFMLLTKEEEKFVNLVKGTYGFQLQSINTDLLTLDNIQPEIVKTLRCTPYLRIMGVKAVKHYIASYIDKLDEMDLEQICFNFGFVVDSGRIDDAKLFRHIKEYVEKAKQGKLTEEDEQPVDLDHFEEDESDDEEDDDVVGVIGYYKGQTIEKQRKHTMTFHEWNEEQKGIVKSAVDASGRGARRGSHSGRGTRGRGGSFRDRFNRTFDKGEKQPDEDDGGDDDKDNKRRKRKQLSKKVKKRINAEKRLKRLGVKGGGRSDSEKKEERKNFANTRGRPGFKRRGK